MMVNFPKEIIEDILVRLPVKSLIRFKCVCKPWLSFISDPQFTKTHLQRAFEADNSNDDYYCKISRRRLLLASSSFVRSMDYKFDGDYDCAGVEDLDFPLTHRILGSCNGLVCMLVDQSNIFLWNPSTRESKKLPPPLKLLESGDLGSFCYGLGYDSSIDDYKVVSVSFSGRESEVEVFTLKTNTWRQIEDIKLNYRNFSAKAGTLYNGALHWVASPGRDKMQAIVSFDLATEKFHEVPEPESPDQPDDDDIFSSSRLGVLGVLGGCLCVLRHTSRVELWLMKEYHVKGSWTKLSTIPWGTEWEPVPLCFSEDGQIVMVIGGHILVRFEAKGGKKTSKGKKVSFLVTYKNTYSLEAALYVESLVSPNGKEGTVKQCTEEKEKKRE